MIARVNVEHSRSLSTGYPVPHPKFAIGTNKNRAYEILKRNKANRTAKCAAG